jgi:hypothetical protein
MRRHTGAGYGKQHPLRNVDDKRHVCRQLRHDMAVVDRQRFADPKRRLKRPAVVSRDGGRINPEAGTDRAEGVPACHLDGVHIPNQRLRGENGRYERNRDGDQCGSHTHAARTSAAAARGPSSSSLSRTVTNSRSVRARPPPWLSPRNDVRLSCGIGAAVSTVCRRIGQSLSSATEQRARPAQCLSFRAFPPIDGGNARTAREEFSGCQAAWQRAARSPSRRVGATSPKRRTAWRSM